MDAGRPRSCSGATRAGGGARPSLDRIVVRASRGRRPLDGQRLGAGRVQVAYPSGFDPRSWPRRRRRRRSRPSPGLGHDHAAARVQHPPRAPRLGAVRQGIAHAIDRAGMVETRRPARGPFGVGGQQPPVRQRRARLRRRRRRLRRAPTRPPPPGCSNKGGLTARRPRDVDVARKAGDLQPGVGERRPVVGGGRAPSWPPSSWRPDSTSTPTRCRAAQLYGHGAADRRLRPGARPRRRPARIPSAMAAVFSTSPAITGGERRDSDWSGFDDPKVDALFTQAVQELAPPQAQSIYHQIDQDCGPRCRRCRCSPSPPCWCRRPRCRGVSDDPGGLGPLWNMRPVGAAGRRPAHGTQDRLSLGADLGVRLALECSMRLEQAAHPSEWRNRQTR